MMAETSAADIVITESRPSELLRALHDRATPELEHLFAHRDALPSDLVLVAWAGDHAAGYLVATDGRDGTVEVWEHAVAPGDRQRGIGRTLLYELARRVPPGAIVRVDPVHQLDLERIADYYGRCGFTHSTARRELWASATEVIRATGRQLTGPRGDPLRLVLAGKAPGVVTIGPDATVEQLVALFDHHRIGAVPVSRDGVRIEGIVSERDVLSQLARGGASVLGRQVGEIMTTDVVTCTASDGVELVMSLMTRLRIRHIPVVAAGQLAAMVSIGDIVRYRLHQLEEENQHIRDYIIAGR
ncbi:MAG: GNAT family N-acetyltransferase [Acidimicrobiales bacterium]|nr:GNAT family N-acetyltransferase [Acidimicrobiales bacterium]